MVVVLAGGVGAARMLRGISAVMDPAQITAIVNTADDTVMHGLRISPDLDTVTYTLAGAIDPDRGWGLVDESWRAMGALARYAAVRPDGSSAAPTRYQTICVTTGVRRSGSTTICSPLVVRQWCLCSYYFHNGWNKTRSKKI